MTIPGFEVTRDEDGHTLSEAIEAAMEDAKGDYPDVSEDELWWDLAKVVLNDWPSKDEARDFAGSHGIQWPLVF